MIRTFRYPLHPTKEQERVLEDWLEHCRLLFNGALQERRNAWQKQKVNISKFDQQKSLTIIKQEDDEFKKIPTTVLRSAIGRVDDAFKGFFRRCKVKQTPGYPRFKGKNRYDSINLPINISSNKQIGRSATVHVQKLGEVKFNQYRLHKGEIKWGCIKREPSGKWFVSLTCDIGEAPTKSKPEKIVGIDLGLISFVTLDNGSTIDNPRFFKISQDKLAVRQRNLSRKKRGSESRKKAKKFVAEAYEHIRNQRLDFVRKQAKKLFDNFDTVCFEDLDVKQLIEGKGKYLAKSINDAGWNLFINCLKSKAEEAGKWAISVDPRNTSQECHACGKRVLKTLADREHVCSCGESLGRDHNSAKVIKARGLRAVTEQCCVKSNIVHPKL